MATPFCTNGNNYQYQPLPPRVDGRTPPFTRILVLAPGSSTSDLLRGRLETINVEHAPPYEALSYTWGLGEPRNHLWLGPHCLPIRPNLDAALQALRGPTHARWLWIDAICIDQSNLDERTRQVQYMRLVYKHATRVIVWLGHKTPGVELAFEAARRLSEAQRCVEESAMASQQPDPVAVTEFRASMIADLPQTSIQHLSDLLNRDYFFRTWCIQEVVSSSEAIARCDDLEISFFDLIVVALEVVEWRRLMTFDNPLMLWHMIYMCRHGDLLYASNVEGSIGDLLGLLQFLRSFKVTDPRDKIFALLGICDEGLQPELALTQIMGEESRLVHGLRRGLTLLQNQVNRLDPDIELVRHPALKPDYKKDTILVYTDLTRFLMRKSPRMLDVLDNVQHRGDPGAGEYPSWVPKWFEQNSCSVMKGCFLAGLCDGHFRYFAEIHDNPLLGRSSRPQVLSLDGYRFDVIQTVSDVMDFTTPSDGITVSVIQRVWSQIFQFPMFSPKIPPYRNGELLEVAFFTTLAVCPLGILVAQGIAKLKTGAKINMPRDSQPSAYQELCQREVLAFLEFLTQRDNGMPQLHQQPLPQSAQNGYTPLLYTIGLRMFSSNRRVFLTREGRIGIGPTMMQPGDEVSVLFGGRLPFIVRPRHDHHILVGNCYVRDDDLMWGKVTENVRFRKGGPPLFTFELR